MEGTRLRRRNFSGARGAGRSYPRIALKESHGLSDSKSRVFSVALLPQSGASAGGEPAAVREVQQSQWTRPQLHAGSDGEGRGQSPLRIRCRLETVKGNTESRSARCSGPPFSEQGSPGVLHPNSDNGKYRKRS